MEFGAYIPLGVFLAELAVRITLSVVILLRRHMDSGTRLAWLVFILLVPFLGAIVYLLVGEVRMGAFRMKRHRDVVLRASREVNLASLVRPVSVSELPEPYGQIASLAESVGGNYVLGGNELTIHGDTDETIDAVVEDIKRAEHHCHLLSYIYLDDRTGRRVAEAMIDAERRKVHCRVLVDGVGSRDFLKSELCQVMRRNGIQVTEALPANPLRVLFHRLDIRNHRKVLVIDSEIGYTGSQNIADAEFAPKRRYAPWVDTMVRIRGPVVADLQRLFCEDWYLDTDEWLQGALEHVPSPVPDHDVKAQVIGTGPNRFNYAMRQVNHAAIHLAHHEIILTTPYFVPDEPTAAALRTAAQRGVQTHLVVPRRNDSWLVAAASRGFYEDLLEAGVRIHEFQAGLLHAKTMTVDRNLAIVTSANLDKRSFMINFEASVIVYDTDFASRLRFLQHSYIDQSNEISHDRWSARPWPRRLWHNAIGMLSPLL